MSENSADALVNRIIMHIMSLFINNPNYTNTYFTDQYYGKYDLKRDVINRAEELIKLINEWRPMIFEKDDEYEEDESICDTCSRPDDGVLERIVADIKKHAIYHYDHGVGCACMDKHAGAIRALYSEKFEAGVAPDIAEKARSNFVRVLSYIVNNP